MRLLLVICLTALAGCKSTPNRPELPAAVPAPKAPDLTAVGSTLDVIDSRVAAAVTIAREANTAGKPAVVESELSVAGSFLPKPTEGDLAYARQRSEKATPADYERQRAKAAEKQKAAEQAWTNLEAQVAASKAALLARDKRIEELTAALKESEESANKSPLRVSAGFCFLAALGLAVVGQYLRAGACVALGGILIGISTILSSPWFIWSLIATVVVVLGLGVWVVFDMARDKVNANPRKSAEINPAKFPHDDVPPQA